MLVDQLIERSESVTLEFTEALEFEFVGHPVFSWSLDEYQHSMPVEWDAFDEFLNILHIPIKYAKRCLESIGGIEIAKANINFWIKQQHGFSLLLQDGMVQQIIEGDRIFVPGVLVNDVVVEKVPGAQVAHYLIEEDTFHAVYVGPQELSFKHAEHPYKLGIRVLYSDCFAVTPHFDGVLYAEKTGAMYCWPVQQRKFRTVNITKQQFYMQIEEFVALALEQITDDVLPALEEVHADAVDPIDFVYRLCSELRINRTIRDQVAAHVNQWALSDEAGVIRLMERISAYCNSGELDFDTARDIQVALTNWVIERSFK